MIMIKTERTHQLAVDDSWPHHDPDPADPREQATYNYTNYVLAGMIIQRTGGHRVSAEINRRIITPLQLRDTSFPETEAHIRGRHMWGRSRGESNGLGFTHSTECGKDIWARDEAFPGYGSDSASIEEGSRQIVIATNSDSAVFKDEEAAALVGKLKTIALCAS